MKHKTLVRACKLRTVRVEKTHSRRADSFGSKATADIVLLASSKGSLEGWTEKFLNVEAQEMEHGNRLQGNDEEHQAGKRKGWVAK